MRDARWAAPSAGARSPSRSIWAKAPPGRAWFCSCGTAAKFAATTILGVVIPGSPAVISLVESAFDAAQEASQDDWEINLARQVETTAANQARLTQMLDILGGDLQHLFAQTASLQKMPDVARQMVEVAQTSDARMRKAVQQLDGLAHRFDRLEQQNNLILAIQEKAHRLLENLAKRPAPPPPPKVCEWCNGSGHCNDCMGTSECSSCLGKGRRRAKFCVKDMLSGPANPFTGKIRCPECSGSGKCGVCRGSAKCGGCKGTGATSAKAGPPPPSANQPPRQRDRLKAVVALMGILALGFLAIYMWVMMLKSL